ncbi:uncharacterized protein BP5553_00902 [Venustampulla echinocandica]|uniref:DNA ligase ATP-dependent N-terminal domain-containing protein n=1 Tax=Venustampulla echinocandica TaxID=2656787 RepID=A0A370TZG2_9HELO|nr:uncharacterized protein BP5553_00902 [Venustampulla echinocandica]RDL40923.1 hypothetical protein BP5553_00902 [Venustampulla echinocandica]
MPFRFVYLCDLLDKLERPFLRDAPLLPHHLEEYTQKEVISWFRRHRDRLNEFSTNGNAVIMMLQPKRWSDRDFGWNVDILEHLIARNLSLSKAKHAELKKWESEPHRGDLAACVERVMDGMERTAVRVDANAVTVEEIDQFLLQTASHNNGSSPEIQALAPGCPKHDPIAGLGNLYQRLQGREAKWLTRLLLKTTEPVSFPADFGIKSNQSHLPNCVRVHVEFPSSAAAILQLGQTGIYKGSHPKEQVPTQTQIPPSNSLGVIPRASRSRIRDSPGFQSKKRRVSRPRPSKEPAKQLVSSSAPPNAASVTTTSPFPQPPPKRCCPSRESSPGAILFKRGVLQPLRPTEISSNSSQRLSISGYSSTEKGTKILRRTCPEAAESTSCPSFRLGALAPASSAESANKFHKAPSSSTECVPNRSLVSSRMTPKKATSTVFCSPVENSRRSRPSCVVNRALQTPPRPTPVLISPGTSPNSRRKAPCRSTILEDCPSRPPAAERVHITKPANNTTPNRQGSAPLLSSIAPHSSNSTVLPPPTRLVLDPNITASNPTIPMITAGTGKCQMNPDTCPLGNCIFLLGPCIPNVPLLLESLLPRHGARYITSLADFSHSSLPRRCPRSSKKYRKIILVEPNHTQPTVNFLKQAEKLNLKRSKGRKQWVEVYDWRLLESIARIDQGKGSILQANSWKKYWMCAV